MVAAAVRVDETKAIIDSLADADDDEYREIIGLIKRERSRFKREILRRVKDNCDVRTKQALIEVLSSSRNPEYIPIYVDGLDSEDEILRVLCLFALQAVRVPEAQKAIEAFKSAQKKTRICSQL